MKKTLLITVCLAAVGLSGCAQTGQFVASNVTTVELSEPNYEIVAAGVSGEAKAGYLFGVSFSNGPQSGSVSLARISGTGQLYKEAMEQLWKNFEKEHGPVEGRHLALANIHYDSDSTNLLLYSDITLAIRADVIEFGEGY
ncbi:MAG: hypothetical protein HN712_16845 [Gemmatimonadetes bacterium]|jgi:hypothetical protein|nr:hypothetical protein [Gemmatimonadota bacterium]MBT6144644.1 hypothetical protein [Gemmatimonadota bacterium]MBT7861986.1 hypothetical protein [Gemmatimonadota bacterium]